MIMVDFERTCKNLRNEIAFEQRRCKRMENEVEFEQRRCKRLEEEIAFEQRRSALFMAAIGVVGFIVGMMVGIPVDVF